jgi:hypothetical protein
MTATLERNFMMNASQDDTVESSSLGVSWVVEREDSRWAGFEALFILHSIHSPADTTPRPVSSRCRPPSECHGAKSIPTC